MTIDEAKRELSEFKYLIRETEYYEEMMAKALGIFPCAFLEERVKTSRSTGTEKLMINYAMAKEILNKKRELALESILRIESVICSLRGEYKEILRRKYINLQSLEEIAYRMNYSYRQVRRLHSQAVQAYSNAKKTSFNA